MKSTISRRLILLLSILIPLTSIVSGQTSIPADGAKQPQAERQPEQKQDLLRELGLTREQFQQIRRMNAERKPLIDSAQSRLREANRSLDDAIYADQVNEQDFQERLKAVQRAQAEVLRIRFINELSVRKVLTPEQLSRFRELRRKFEERRANVQTQRPIQNLPQPMRQNVLAKHRLPKF